MSARGRKRAKKAAIEQLSYSASFEVEFSATAASVYSQLHENMRKAEAGGELGGAHHTIFRMVEQTIKNVIPRDPLNRSYGLAGPLSRFFRIKKGRFRICWAASSEKKKIVILFISETLRKQGDANDPYNIFTRLVMSGKFDELLKNL